MGSSISSVVVILQFLLNFSFVWFLYLFCISSNLAFVSFTLTFGGEGGFFLFLEVDLGFSSCFLDSESVLLHEIDLPILYFPSYSLDDAAAGVGSFLASDCSPGSFSAIFDEGFTSEFEESESRFEDFEREYWETSEDSRRISLIRRIAGTKVT